MNYYGLVYLCMYLMLFCEQSYLLGSHSSLRTDSLGLDLSSTAHSGVDGLGTGREENINFLSDLSDDDDDNDTGGYKGGSAQVW